MKLALLRRRGCVALLALAAAGCGYHFSQRYATAGGVSRIHVRTFVNGSTEPELGAVVTSALRSELARRGAEGGEGAGAVLDGEVRAGEAALTATTGATWRIAIEVRARLVVDGKPPVERVVRREEDFLGGTVTPLGVPEPLETEGRRAVALRRAAEEAARDLLRAYER
jgi:hypothetical protein